MSCFVCGRNSEKRLPGFVQIRRIQQRRDQNERFIVMGIIISLFFAETEKSSDDTEAVKSLPPAPALSNPEIEKPRAHHHHAVLQVNQTAETLSIDFVLNQYDTLQFTEKNHLDKFYFATPPVEIQGRLWWLRIYKDGDEAESAGHLSCYLWCDVEVHAEMSMTLKHSSDATMSIQRKTKSFKPDFVHGIGWNKFVESAHFAAHFATKGSTVTFHVAITIFGQVEGMLTTNPTPPSADPPASSPAQFVPHRPCICGCLPNCAW